MFAILLASATLQLSATAVAVWIAQRNRWSPGWTLLGLALSLMTARAIYELAATTKGATPDDQSALGVLLTSALLAMAVGLLARAFATKTMLAEELAAAKQEIERASQAKTDFLTNISHELRTPLNAVIGFSQVMRQEILGPLGNARYRDYAGGIEESGLHLLRLIDDIMDVSQIESGAVELREEWVTADELMESAARLIRPKADIARVLLYVQPGQDLPVLHVDPLRIKQILINLLANAVKFTPAGGRVELRAGQGEAGGFRFEVTDTGIGIAFEDLERVTRPLDRGQSSYTRSHEGPGLGLPIARGLAELHGGRLRLDSIMHHGTTVLVDLPPERVGQVGAGTASTRL